MDRVQDGVTPMLKNLEDHIISAGLADMIAAADIITQVRINILYYFGEKSIFVSI